MKTAACLQGFAQQYGDAQGAQVFFAPGRVNLIGEHTDYNGGHALPCALSMGTYLVIRKRADSKFRLYSDNFAATGVITYNFDALLPGTQRLWTAYACGVVWELAKRGKRLPCGFDMWVCGDIPNGAGLSSSASLEVATAYAISSLYALELSCMELAHIGQAAENGFVGMNCGIMDQFAVAMGKKDCAIFLNAETLAYQYAPLALQGVDILIMDTRKKRGLKDSKYNERVAECQCALQTLRRHAALSALCDADETLLTRCRAELDESVYRRARHVITENARTKQAFAALQCGDLVTFGKLMNASHTSLETDYEVTGQELDSLVHAAWSCEGVIGARMTGAGFGGCAVALVEADKTKAVQQAVAEKYRAETGRKAAFYVAAPGNGPCRLEACREKCD